MSLSEPFRLHELGLTADGGEPTLKADLVGTLQLESGLLAIVDPMWVENARLSAQDLDESIDEHVQELFSRAALHERWGATGDEAHRVLVPLGGLLVRWPPNPDFPLERHAFAHRTLDAVERWLREHPEEARPFAKPGEGGLPAFFGQQSASSSVRAALRSLEMFGAELEPLLPRLLALADQPRIGAAAAACIRAAVMEDRALLPAPPWPEDRWPKWYRSLVTSLSRTRA